jgi:hypothetical protein
MAMYYIQYAGETGEVALWWKPEGSGYTADLDAAGVFDEKFIKRLPRPIDIPWPVRVVREASQIVVLRDKLPAR